MTKTNHPELYPEKWDQALVVAVGVVDDAINLLQGAPPLGHQLHRLLVPVMDPPLRIQRVGELVGEPGMGGRRGGGGRHPPSRRREHRGRCPSPSSANPG
jgi:hypothetical protein